jgi:membrane protease YdiL (CAAX protease family)
VGTISEWIGVLELGAMWGVGMWAFGGIAGRKASARMSNLASLTLSSFLFGMLTEFGWRRVVHGGIAVVFAMMLVGLLVVGLAERRARKRSGASSGTARQ